MKKIITLLSLSLITLHSANTLSQSSAEYSNSIYNQAVSLLDSGKEMEKIRGSHNVDENLQCSKTMKSNMTKADELNASASSLAVTDFQLKLAAIELYSCVTCATDAMESCNRASKALKEFSKK